MKKVLFDSNLLPNEIAKRGFLEKKGKHYRKIVIMIFNELRVESQCIDKDEPVTIDFYRYGNYPVLPLNWYEISTPPGSSMPLADSAACFFVLLRECTPDRSIQLKSKNPLWH